MTIRNLVNLLKLIKLTIDYYESEKISVPYKYYFSTHFTSAAFLGELATVRDYLDPYLKAT